MNAPNALDEVLRIWGKHRDVLSTPYPGNPALITAMRSNALAEMTPYLEALHAAMRVEQQRNGTVVRLAEPA